MISRQFFVLDLAMPPSVKVSIFVVYFYMFEIMMLKFSITNSLEEVQN